MGKNKFLDDADKPQTMSCMSYLKCRLTHILLLGCCLLLFSSCCVLPKIIVFERLMTSQNKLRKYIQKILVFQQNGSGESKIQGIIRYGENLFDLKTISIDKSLPPVIDDSTKYLPTDIKADLVLDYLTHPDLSHDLAVMCVKKKIPVVATGKKSHIKGVLTPPT